LRANPARKSHVAAVFVRPDDGAYFNVLSLGSLDSVQGRIPDSYFESLKATYSKSMPSIGENEDVRKRIDEISILHLHNKLSRYDFARYLVDRGNEFSVFGTADASIEGVNVQYLTGQRMIYLNGCVVTVNFGVPADLYDAGDLFSAVWELRVGL
jgi:hypothetical protein